jgi:hypothetical protein
MPNHVKEVCNIFFPYFSTVKIFILENILSKWGYVNPINADRQQAMYGLSAKDDEEDNYSSDHRDELNTSDDSDNETPNDGTQSCKDKNKRLQSVIRDLKKMLPISAQAPNESLKHIPDSGEVIFSFSTFCFYIIDKCEV